MRKIRIAAFTLVPVLVLAGLLYAGDDSWGPGSPYNSRFNPDTVETLSGEIIKMDLFKPKGMGMGVEIILKTDEDTVSVHLGPLWYMNRQKREIAPGDRVEVTGSRVDSAGKEWIMASEIRKDDKRLVLRDENGVPVWGREKK